MRLRPRLLHEVIVETREERRKWSRETLPMSEFGIIFPRYDEEGREIAPEDRPDTLLVLVINRSKNGFLLKSPVRFKIGSLLQMQTRLPHEDVWVPSVGKVVRTADSPTDEHFCFLSVELDPKRQPEDSSKDSAPTGKKGMSPRDLEFFKGIRLLDTLSDEAKCRLLNSMKQHHIVAGERFITQGTKGDTFYVVREGSCVVSVEKEGTDHPIARRRAGDIVGEMALFTGEPRNAHVDAETDMKLWSITKTQFDALCKRCPDVQDFLTELITHRLSSESFTADRNVGKYVINEIIGRGGWSIVYKGLHRHLNMPVAIKMLKHDLAMDSDFSEKFRYEAKTIAQFNHENIVKVYDIEELYRTIFIITEYLEGMPLDYILEKMPKLPLSRALDILLQVCEGLSYAHNQGVVHQDIKPANIFVGPNDQVKIVDFGLACSPGTTDTSLEGTIFYAAPEVINGESADERADIYSLGVTAFEMITGQRPFPEDDITKLMDAGPNRGIPDPRTLVPDLPEQLCKFIIGATQRDPASRYRTISQALLDLEPITRDMEETRRPRFRQQGKMISLFLFYQDHHELTVKRLVENIGQELNEIGAELRAAEFKDV